jgi:hypothetical protein
MLPTFCSGHANELEAIRVYATDAASSWISLTPPASLTTTIRAHIKLAVAVVEDDVNPDVASIQSLTAD